MRILFTFAYLNNVQPLSQSSLNDIDCNLGCALRSMDSSDTIFVLVLVPRLLWDLVD